MHRRWYTRFGSLLLAAWFALYATEPVAALHHCPMHDGTMGSMGTMVMGATGPVAPSFVPSGDHEHAPPNHACTCMGDCAGAAFAFRGAGGVVAIPVVPTTRVGPLAYPTYFPVAAPHALPFSNGPPARA